MIVSLTILFYFSLPCVDSNQISASRMPGPKSSTDKKDAKPKVTKQEKNAGKSASQKKEEQKAHKAAKQAKKNER